MLFLNTGARFEAVRCRCAVVLRGWWYLTIDFTLQSSTIFHL